MTSFGFVLYVIIPLFVGIARVLLPFLEAEVVLPEPLQAVRRVANRQSITYAL